MTAPLKRSPTSTSGIGMKRSSRRIRSGLKSFGRMTTPPRVVSTPARCAAVARPRGSRRSRSSGRRPAPCSPAPASPRGSRRSRCRPARGRRHRSSRRSRSSRRRSPRRAGCARPCRSRSARAARCRWRGPRWSGMRSPSCVRFALVEAARAELGDEPVDLDRVADGDGRRRRREDEHPLGGRRVAVRARILVEEAVGDQRRDDAQDVGDGLALERRAVGGALDLVDPPHAARPS